MTDIEFEMPKYHPKGCGCVVCQAIEEVLDALEKLQAENAALRAEVERLQGALKLGYHEAQRENAALRAEVERLNSFLTYSADVARLKNP